MGVSVVPADLESPPNLQEQEEDPPALTAGTASGVAATLDETLQHMESVGRPHDWWWAVNNWRRRHVMAAFGKDNCTRLEATLTSKYWLILTLTLTFFCLYAVDVCDVAKGGIDAGAVVSAILLAVFVLFSLELLLSSIFVDKYLLSFFFWVDLVGTASLILDIKWFVAGILSSEDANSLQVTRAGRCARVGSQMGRITRVLRMVRALRLLKALHLRKRFRQGMDPIGLKNGPIRPTVLGELLAESTTRKCVLAILFVLVVATFLQTFPATAADYNRIQLVSYGVMTPEAFIQSAAYPIIMLSYVDVLGGGRTVDFLPYTRTGMRAIMQLRTKIECARYRGAEVEACGYPEDFSTVWYDVSGMQQLNAGLNIALTTVIIACLGLSAYFFGRDATTYVIMPIETMLKYLRRMIMVGVDGDVESESINLRKPPETDVLANYVSRLVNEIGNARWKAEEEARISDTLLNSMVPPRIARQLKELRWWEAGPEQRAQTIADSFAHATVLFTDIVGFTVLSSRISAEDAMRHLNNMYTIFDEIVEKYGLYKVETIGDSYMLVGGAPEEREDHAERVAAAALEIRACVPLLQQISGEPAINVRIGMHSGAVTAGVVGFKNPRWHLFGDTCNTASRMESTGIAGEIQLSCTTYELIKDRFQCKVRGKIAVKGKGEMVTYLLEREYGADNPPESPSGLLAAGTAVAGLLGAVGGGAGSGGGDAEAFLTSPQFRKAMERYTAARNSFLTEEEELCKLLKSLDEPTAMAAAAAAGAGNPPSPPSPSPSPMPHGVAAAAAAAAAAVGISSTTTTTEAVAAAGLVVPRLAAGLSSAAFKQLVLGTCTPSDLKALALHMHEEVGMARAMMVSAEEEKAAGIRRDMLLKLYARVLEAPGMSLRDTFAAILDTMYKVIECDVIKMYVVDHGRAQLWPVTRHSAADRTLPLEGTLAGSAVRRARVVRVDDVAREEEFNVDLEELPAGYTSKSVMCVPVFSATNYHAPIVNHAARLYGGTAAATIHGCASLHPPSAAGPAGQAGPSPGDVIAVLVMVNRWTPWREAGVEEGERRIVPFAAADEASVRDAADSVGLLLMRRRGEMLLASAVPPSCLAGASFSVAALPSSVVRRRLRTVVRRSSVALLDTRGNLWAIKQEGLMGQARDVLSALQRRVNSRSLSVLGAAGEEVLLSYLVRIADEQGAGRFFNLAHSVGVLQGIYLTLRWHMELAEALGPQHLLALVLAASMLNIDRDGELLLTAPTAGGALSISSGTVVSGSAAGGRNSKARTVGGSAGVAAAAVAGVLDLSSPQLRDASQLSTPTSPLPPPPPQKQQQEPSSSTASIQNGVLAAASSWRNSEPVIGPTEGGESEQRDTVQMLCASSFGTPPAANAPMAAAAAARFSPRAVSSKRWSGGFTPAPEADATAAATSAAPSSPQVCNGTFIEDATVPASSTKAPALTHTTSRSCLPATSLAVQPSTSVSGAALLPASIITSNGAGAGAGGGGGSGIGPAGFATGQPSRNRAVSARRGRLAAIVDDILSGESNILAGLPMAEAAAIKVYVVTLLALRNQPATVLSMPGLQPYQSGAPVDDYLAAAVAEGGGLASASAGLASTTTVPASASPIVDSVYGSTVAVSAAVAEAEAVAGGNGNPDTDNDGGGGEIIPNGGLLAFRQTPNPRVLTVDADCSSSQRPTGAVVKESGFPGGCTSPHGPAGTAALAGLPEPPVEAIATLSANKGVGGGGGGCGVATAAAATETGASRPLSLSALIQAAGSDALRLAETRTAVCALLLLTWSEQIHVRDPDTALSLLQCRATDVRTWASRLAANVSGRRRTASLLGAMDFGVDDVQNLLLLEVPRMQLEVIPLWQRTVELLPGLQPQLDALQANRATYVSMLQDTASLTAILGHGGVGGGGAAAATAVPGTPGAASAQRGSSGSVATAGSGPPSTYLKSSMIRGSSVALDGTRSGREPRRFISVKCRGAPARGILAVLPSEDSGSSTAAGGGGVSGCGGTRGRPFVRAASSRSYGGRNGPDYFDVLEGGGATATNTAALGTAVFGSSSRLLRQVGFAITSGGGARSMHHIGSRSGGPAVTSGSRLASLAVPSSAPSMASVAAAATAAAAADGLDNTAGIGCVASAFVGGQCMTGSNQSLVRQGSGQALGFRPSAHTHDLCTAPSGGATNAATMSPVETSGGQRRTSITRRINHLFMSFRASGRSSQRPQPPTSDIASSGGGGGGGGSSSHTNAVVMSPVAGAPGSPLPQPSPFMENSPFELYGYGYGTHEAGGGACCASQVSQQLSLALVAAAVAGAPGQPGADGGGSGGDASGAPLSPTLSAPLYSSAGGWGEPVLASQAPASPIILQQSSQPSAVLPIAASARNATALPTAGNPTTGLELTGLPAAAVTTAVVGPASPYFHTKRAGTVLNVGGKLRASIMRRLSHVAAKLPFYHATTTVPDASGPRDGATAAEDAAFTEAGLAAGTTTAAAAAAVAAFGSASAVALTVSDGGTGLRLLANADRAERQFGSVRGQTQNYTSLPLATAPPETVLRSATIQVCDRAHDGPLQQQQRLSHPQLFSEQAVVTKPRRATAPSGALALAQQHEQYAATVAAAAVAFAARQAAAKKQAAAAVGATATATATSAANVDGDGGNGDTEDSVSLRTPASIRSLTGGIMIGTAMLPTVAEFTGSGRNSSATFTARSNSTAAPGETPKNAGTPLSLTLTGAVPTTTTIVATAANPSRFGPSVVPSEVAPSVVVAAAGTAVAALPAPALLSSFLASYTPHQAPELAAAAAARLPTRASASLDNNGSGATAPSVASISAAVSPQGRIADGTADYTDPCTTPTHRASSKGVWLGLRLATDALKSVGRRPDGGCYSASSSGALVYEAGLLTQPETETPMLPSAFPAIAAHRSSLRLAATASASVGVGCGSIGSAGAGSSANGSRNPSRLQTPAASLHRGGGTGSSGVASLQAVIDMAEAALTGGTAAAYSPSRLERGVSVGEPGPCAGPGMNHSYRRPTAVSGVQTSAAVAIASGGANGGGGVTVSAALALQPTGSVVPAWVLDEALNQRASAPPGPSRFSLRRAAASRKTSLEQVVPVAAASGSPTWQPEQPPEQHP